MHRLMLCAALGLATATARAGPIHVEFSDAGPTIATAQVAGDGSGGPLTNILGRIAVGGGADVYRISISNPAAFSATTSLNQPVGFLSDPQLFLFRENGTGVYTNDDDGVSLQSQLPAGHPDGPTTPGVYYLAVTGFNNDPVDALANLIFPNTFPGVFGPNDPNRVFDSFDGNLSGTGPYNITLTGVTNGSAVPEPATLAALGLLAVGGAAARRRRA